MVSTKSTSSSKKTKPKSSSKSSASASASASSHVSTLNQFLEEDIPFDSFHNAIENIVSVLQGRKNIVVLVGAGISVSCGIPDFRSEKTGIYHTMDANELGLSTPEELFHLECFQDDPRPFYKFATKMLYPIKPIEPSSSHHFLSILEKKKILLRVYTQNIDGLEEKAGVSSKKIVYAHGTLNTSTCLTCGAKASADELREEILLGNIPHCKRLLKSSVRSGKKPRKRKRNDIVDTTSDDDVKNENVEETEKSAPLASSSSSSSNPKPFLPPPVIKPRRRRSTSNESTSHTTHLNTSNPYQQRTCSGVMKPNITFFGEPLVDRVRKCLESDRKKADAVIVIGTSLSVAPMSKIIEYLSPSIPRILINQKIVVPKHGVYGEDGGRKMNDSDVNHVDADADADAEADADADADQDSSSNGNEKDHRTGYIFDACLLGNCDEVTTSLMNVMKIPKSCATVAKHESITTSQKKKKNMKYDEFEILMNIPELKEQVSEKMLFRHPYCRIILFPGAMLGPSKEDNDGISTKTVAGNKNENDESLNDIVYKEVVHCDGCQSVIEETVMKCSNCFDFDLCMECYNNNNMAKKHFSGKHRFVVEKL